MARIRHRKAPPTRVVHVKDHVPGAIYIGRANRYRKLPASPLANPFRIGPDGDRKAVLEQYARWIEGKILAGDRRVIEELLRVKGAPLACWCRSDGEAVTADTACHGDLIAALADEASEELSRVLSGLQGYDGRATA